MGEVPVTPRNMLLGAAIVATGIIAILAFVTWALIFRAIPGENKEAVTLLIGVLAANTGTVVGYYFGSTAANRSKDATIATLSSRSKGEGVEN